MRFTRRKIYVIFFCVVIATIISSTVPAVAGPSNPMPWPLDSFNWPNTNSPNPAQTGPSEAEADASACSLTRTCDPSDSPQSPSGSPSPGSPQSLEGTWTITVSATINDTVRTYSVPGVSTDVPGIKLIPATQSGFDTCNSPGLYRGENFYAVYGCQCLLGYYVQLVLSGVYLF